MANFNLKQAPGLIQSKDTNFNNVLSNVKPPEIKLGEKSIGYDFHKEMDILFKSAQEKKNDKIGGLVTGDFDLIGTTFAISRFDMVSAWKGIVTTTESDQFLSQAKQLITQKEFQKALAELNKILELHKLHHEATYLKAYCQESLKAVENALQTLAPLRQANLTPILQTRVEALKEKIRKHILPILFLEMMLKTLTVTRLHNLIALDPEMGMYYFLLAAKLMEIGQIVEALAIISKGICNSTTNDHQKLEAFQKHLEQLYLRQILKPAINLFKEGRYLLARSELTRNAQTYKSHQLVITFDVYLNKLDQIGSTLANSKSKGIPPPSGKPEDVHDLYLLLIGEDIEKANNFLQYSHLFEAEQILKQARQYTPAFPFVNYMLGGCMYQRLQVELFTGGRDLESIILGLQQARAYAMAGGDAEGLIHAIDEFNVMLNNVLEMIKVRQKEEGLANSVIKEFQDIMNSAQGGIRGIQHLEDVRKRMLGLKPKLSAVKKSITISEILRVLEELTKVVQTNLQQLDEIENEVKESEIVNHLGEMFKKIMDSAHDGIQSPAQLNDAYMRFKTLKKEIDATKAIIKSQGCKSSLTQLDKAVLENISQLNSIRESFEDRKCVDPHIAAFNILMQRITSQGRIEQYQVYSFRQEFHNLKKQVEADKWKLKSRDAQKAIDDLLMAINNILTQLDRY